MDYYNFYKNRHDEEIKRKNDFWPKYQLLISYIVILSSSLVFIFSKVEGKENLEIILVFIFLSVICVIASATSVIVSFRRGNLIDFDESRAWEEWHKELEEEYGNNVELRDEAFEKGVIQSYIDYNSVNQELNDKIGYDIKKAISFASLATAFLIVAYLTYVLLI